MMSSAAVLQLECASGLLLSYGIIRGRKKATLKYAKRQDGHEQISHKYVTLMSADVNVNARWLPSDIGVKLAIFFSCSFLGHTANLRLQQLMVTKVSIFF